MDRHVSPSWRYDLERTDGMGYCPSNPSGMYGTKCCGGVSQRFIKSSFSGLNCVEAFVHEGIVSVRDSKKPERLTLHFPTGAWTDILQHVRDGYCNPTALRNNPRVHGRIVNGHGVILDHVLDDLTLMYCACEPDCKLSFTSDEMKAFYDGVLCNEFDVEQLKAPVT